jgi:hypothetical protein
LQQQKYAFFPRIAKIFFTGATSFFCVNAYTSTITILLFNLLGLFKAIFYKQIED